MRERRGIASEERSSLLFQDTDGCPHCGANRNGHFGLCRGCESELEYVGARSVLRRSSHSYLCYSALFYNNFLRHLVVSYKKEQQTWIGPIFARILARYVEQHPVLSKLHWVSFVPQSQHKEILRASHPAREMAESVARFLRVPLLDLLEKRGWRPAQKTLGRAERAQNVIGAFSLRSRASSLFSRPLPNGVLAEARRHPGIVVDDFLTTGATMSEVLQTLEAQGIVAIGLCLAKVREPAPAESEGIWNSAQERQHGTE